ncbi:MAG: ABC transporter ATP-binding protein [Gemmatimonadaceae bacterium]
MIRFEDLTVHYPSAPPHRAAVSGVSLEALRSRVTAIAGPNGSGKSTLVRTLLRSLSPSSGDVYVDAVSIGSLDRRALARRIAVVTQREESVFALPVRDYVALGRHPHHGPWTALAATDHAAIGRAYEMAELGALVDRNTAELSGGEWQRVRIARALAQGGEALVLDEPNTFLDIAHEMALFELLALLARENIAVLVVSHQLNLVARFADHIVLLDRGFVAAAGSPAEVMRAETLERVYRWPIVVTRDPAVGAPALLPLRRSRTLHEKPK